MKATEFPTHDVTSQSITSRFVEEKRSGVSPNNLHFAYCSFQRDFFQFPRGLTVYQYRPISAVGPIIKKNKEHGQSVESPIKNHSDVKIL
jgi:hypothetical protein